jgi:hypothetical protein
VRLGLRLGLGLGVGVGVGLGVGARARLRHLGLRELPLAQRARWRLVVPHLVRVRAGVRFRFGVLPRLLLRAAGCSAARRAYGEAAGG